MNHRKSANEKESTQYRRHNQVVHISGLHSNSFTKEIYCVFRLMLTSKHRKECKKLTSASASVVNEKPTPEDEPTSDLARRFA